MSYSEPKRLSGWRRFTLIAYIAVGFLLLPLTFMFSMAAGCPAFAYAGCEPAGDLVRYAIFPGFSFAMLLAGVVFQSWLKRKQA